MAATVGCATGGDRRRCWWFTVASGVVFLLSLSFIFHSLLRFFFLLLSAFTFSFLFFLCSSLPSLFCSPHLSRALPCIYRKNRGDRGRGRPLCSHPKNCPRNTPPPSSPTRRKLRASGVGRRLFERELAVENRGRKNLLLPLLRASRGRRKVTVPFKTAPFWYFFLIVHETASFWAKRAISFKRKRRKKCVRVHIGPQFVICSIES